MLSVANKQKKTTKNPRRPGELGEAGVVSTGIAEILCHSNPARLSRNRRNSLSSSSIGWRRGPGRGGTLDAPLLGPLPTSASRGEEAEARFRIFAQKNNIFMDSNLVW